MPNWSIFPPRRSDISVVPTGRNDGGESLEAPSISARSGSPVRQARSSSPSRAITPPLSSAGDDFELIMKPATGRRGSEASFQHVSLPVSEEGIDTALSEAGFLPNNPIMRELAAGMGLEKFKIESRKFFGIPIAAYAGDPVAHMLDALQKADPIQAMRDIALPHTFFPKRSEIDPKLILDLENIQNIVGVDNDGRLQQLGARLCLARMYEGIKSDRDLKDRAILNNCYGHLQKADQDLAVIRKTRQIKTGDADLLECGIVLQRCILSRRLGYSESSRDLLKIIRDSPDRRSIAMAWQRLGTLMETGKIDGGAGGAAICFTRALRLAQDPEKQRELIGWILATFSCSEAPVPVRNDQSVRKRQVCEMLSSLNHIGFEDDLSLLSKKDLGISLKKMKKEGYISQSVFERITGPSSFSGKPTLKELAEIIGNCSDISKTDTAQEAIAYARQLDAQRAYAEAIGQDEADHQTAYGKIAIAAEKIKDHPIEDAGRVYADLTNLVGQRFNDQPEKFLQEMGDALAELRYYQPNVMLTLYKNDIIINNEYSLSRAFQVIYGIESREKEVLPDEKYDLSLSGKYLYNCIKALCKEVETVEEHLKKTNDPTRKQNARKEIVEFQLDYYEPIINNSNDFNERSKTLDLIKKLRNNDHIPVEQGTAFMYKDRSNPEAL